MQFFFILGPALVARFLKLAFCQYTVQFQNTLCLSYQERLKLHRTQFPHLLQFRYHSFVICVKISLFAISIFLQQNERISYWIIVHRRMHFSTKRVCSGIFQNFLCLRHIYHRHKIDIANCRNTKIRS